MLVARAWRRRKAGRLRPSAACTTPHRVTAKDTSEQTWGGYRFPGHSANPFLCAPRTIQRPSSARAGKTITRTQQYDPARVAAPRILGFVSSTNAYRAPVLADVAKMAGVSVPTVSRVLTGSKFVATDLNERVMRAVRELGYRPNSAARAMRSGKRSQLAVLSGGTSNYGYVKTIEGVETAARRAGMSLVIRVIKSADEADVAAAIDTVLSQPVAGLIVLEFDRAGRAALRALPTGVPVVATGGGSRRSGSVPYALIDERSGGREATEYLLGVGHRTVHHIAGPTMGKHSGRTEGWRAALTAAGAEVPAVMPATWEPISGYRWGEKIASRDDVTAVFCGNDDLAFGLIRALTERGVRVPEDISVLGFDDQPHAAMWSPTLTSVQQDFVDLGERAFSLLTRVVDGEQGLESSVTVPRLVIRESTAPPRADLA